jgi:hypothetical protein
LIRSLISSLASLLEEWYSGENSYQELIQETFKGTMAQEKCYFPRGRQLANSAQPSGQLWNLFYSNVWPIQAF